MDGLLSSHQEEILMLPLLQNDERNGEENANRFSAEKFLKMFQFQNLKAFLN